MPAAVAGKFKRVGSPHWTSGPIGIVPIALHGLWATDFTEADGKALGKLKKRVLVAESKGIRGLMFPRLAEAGCFQHGSTVVLVEARDADGRPPRPLEPVLKAAAEVELDDKAWKLVTRYTPHVPHVLCDAWAKDVHGEGKRDRRSKLALALALEDYVVEEARGVTHEVQPFPNKARMTVTYTFTRLRPANAAPVKAKAKPAPPATPGVLVASPDVVKAAKRLRFVDSDQTCSVILPRAALRTWSGLDGDDYDRACAVSGVGLIAVDGGKALAIGMDSAMAFHPTATGGLVLMWVGADSATGVLASALALPEARWQKTKVTWDVGDGKLVLIGAPTVGKTAGKARVDIALRRGRYRVETCWRWECDVRVGKRVESTMIAALRLVR